MYVAGGLYKDTPRKPEAPLSDSARFAAMQQAKKFPNGLVHP
jgi:hypothetical protein